jgi:iron(III) transport system ATP-binding protein
MSTEAAGGSRSTAHAADLLLRGEGLTKDYGPRRVLDAVDLAVPRSSFLVLLGPSGSGKTTLLRCIAGTERLSGGSLWIDGREVAGPRQHLASERRGLSMVFQDYALWPHMTAAENVGFALRRLGLGGAERRQRTLTMLERVGLSDQAGTYPNQLSGGQQQRVALARALVAGTPLLLCDEPLSNLDAHLREQVRVEIATLSRDSGATVVYITHDQQEAFALADQVAVINEGRILQLGAPEEVYRHPATAFVARFTGLSGSIEGMVTGRLAADRVQVQTADCVIDARAMREISVGARVDILLRVDALSLASGEGDRPGLVGVVRDSSFRAGAYDHVVDLPSGRRLTGVRAASRARRGSSVALALSVEGSLAFPRQHGASSSTPPGSAVAADASPALGDPDPPSEVAAAGAR